MRVGPSWTPLAFVILLAAAPAAPIPAGGVVHGPDVVEIPSGPFIFGSDRAEREAGYRLDETAYGHRVTRDNKWYESEFARQRGSTSRYYITRTPVTNAQYHDFVDATGRASPDVDAKTWKSYGLIHPWPSTRRHAWKNAAPPSGRDDHPVVLVSYDDALAYAAWLTKVTAYRWRLPTEHEWEKAARGDDGRRYPWGDGFDGAKLNSHDKGPFDTVPVGMFPAGASPYGLLDPAGQVFEWTATSAGDGRSIVKGGSWDDKGCGVCRPAARHSRPHFLKHILVGFRLVREDP